MRKKEITINQMAYKIIRDFNIKAINSEILFSIPEELGCCTVNEKNALNVLIELGNLTKESIGRFAQFIGTENWQTDPIDASTLSQYLLIPEVISNEEFLYRKVEVIFFIALMRLVSSSTKTVFGCELVVTVE